MNEDYIDLDDGQQQELEHRRFQALIHLKQLYYVNIEILKYSQDESAKRVLQKAERLGLKSDFEFYLKELG